eukprot:TRINITY_DN7940_c1_g1_i1.p2 TRINITY_DN7940_c1_g1~~TRINITY_DN7940_c1_g1_i1.p2  ORF type:complete len:211 (+),score=-1.97 TRINITY_DN7940_c1_g1_i1:681-1313(+)
MTPPPMNESVFTQVLYCKFDYKYKQAMLVAINGCLYHLKKQLNQLHGSMWCNQIFQQNIHKKSFGHISGTLFTRGPLLFLYQATSRLHLWCICIQLQLLIDSTSLKLQHSFNAGADLQHMQVKNRVQIQKTQYACIQHLKFLNNWVYVAHIHIEHAGKKKTFLALNFEVFFKFFISNQPYHSAQYIYRTQRLQIQHPVKIEKLYPRKFTG